MVFSSCINFIKSSQKYARIDKHSTFSKYMQSILSNWVTIQTRPSDVKHRIHCAIMRQMIHSFCEHTIFMRRIWFPFSAIVFAIKLFTHQKNGIYYQVKWLLWSCFSGRFGFLHKYFHREYSNNLRDTEDSKEF